MGNPEAKPKANLKKREIMRKNGPLRSIQQCLVALGAPSDEIYFSPKWRDSKYKGLGKAPYDSLIGTRSRLIYERFDIDELTNYVRELWLNAIKTYHPDTHPENRKACEAMTSRVNQAYDKAMHILNYRRYGRYGPQATRVSI
jgi:hypothetical protein